MKIKAFLRRSTQIAIKTAREETFFTVSNIHDLTKRTWALQAELRAGHVNKNKASDWLSDHYFRWALSK